MNKIIFGAIFGIIIILLYPTIGETSEKLNDEKTFEEIKQGLENAQTQRLEKELPNWILDAPEMKRHIEVDKKQVADIVDKYTVARNEQHQSSIRRGGANSESFAFRASSAIGQVMIITASGLLTRSYVVPIALGALLSVGSNVFEYSANFINKTGKNLSEQPKKYDLIALGLGVAEVFLDSGIARAADESYIDTQSFASLIAAFIITWVVGLSPIIITRYFIVKHPISKKKANWIAVTNSVIGWSIFSTIAIMNGEKAGTGVVWILVFYVSMKILSYNKGKYNIDNNFRIKNIIEPTEQGSTAEQFLLGIEIVRHNHEEGFKLITKSAQHGYADAQCFLGAHYEINKNSKEALEWYTKSAEQGHVGAQYSLAGMYDSDELDVQDFKEALKWYTKAAEQGHAWAQYFLGGMYDSGRGVSQNYKESYIWYNLAAANGVTDSVSNRDRVASKLSSEQLVQAQSLAKEYHAKYANGDK